MPILGVIASAITGNLSTNSFESIETVTVGSGGQSTISFTSIPQSYKHLQIRVLSRITNNDTNINVVLNSDTGNNYYAQYSFGNGSGVGAGQLSIPTGPPFMIRTTSSASTANNFGAAIIEMLDYTNANKHKTFRSINGFDNNGSGETFMTNGHWANTSAVTRIDLNAGTGNLAQFSSFALYGIKG